MQLLLSFLAGIAAYAGYKSWPLYVVPLIGVVWVIWNLVYFGSQSLRIATGGPLAYLFRAWVINSIQAAVLYGLGAGFKWLVG